MAVRKFKKSSDGTYMWESMSSSVKRRPTQDWCAFILLKVGWYQNQLVKDLVTCTQKISVQTKHLLKVELLGHTNEN